MEKQRRVFLPSNFNLAEQLNQRPPQFKFNIDYFKHVSHLINDIYFRDEDRYKQGWVPLCSSILVNYIRDYQKYLNYLIVHGIVECDNHYIPNEKCKYYRFTDAYRNEPLKEELINDSSLIRKLSQYSYKDDDYKKANQRYGYLTKHFKSGKLRIDSGSAKEWLIATYPPNHEAYKRGIMAIKRIEEQDWHFSIGEKDGRFYSNLTCLPKELRWFLTYDGQPLVCIDVANMQPLLVNAFFKESFWHHPYSSTDFRFKNINKEVFERLKACKYGDSSDYVSDYILDYIKYINSIMLAESPVSSHQYEFQDVGHYRELTTGGGFYSFLQGELSEIYRKNVDREQAKEFVMKFLNGDADAAYYQDQTKINPMTVFAGLFPAIYELLCRLKVVNYKHVSWLMLGMESKLMLDIICKRVDKLNPDMPLFTVHDSIITTPDNANYLYEEMKSQLELHVGYPPFLKGVIWDYDYMMGNFEQRA